MPYNSNERLEREARESLVASDLSAKMKQWRDPGQPPKEDRNGLPPILLLLLLLAAAGAFWLFWPEKAPKTNPAPEQPAVLPPPSVPPAEQPALEPIAQNNPPSNNPYLALAQASYKAPDFSTEIRGEDPKGQDLLNKARRALADHRYPDALKMLQAAPAEYQSDAAYLRGHALFGQKKYAQAATIFGQLTGSVRYGESAQWYEILARLPDMETDKAWIMKKLKSITDDEGHLFYQEAKEISSKIGRKM